jgi:hypothetical protein
MGNLMSVKRQGGLPRVLAKKTNCGTKAVLPQYLSATQYWRKSGILSATEVTNGFAPGLVGGIIGHLLAAKIEGLVTPTTALRKGHMCAYARLAAQQALGSLAGPSGPCAWKEHA